MIVVSEVSKRFRDQQVLNKVTAMFPERQITGIVGRNGSGKTVLLKCIIGLMKPDEGSITVGGRTIGKEDDFAPDTGFIVDRPGFLNDLSGYKNLKYLASIRNIAKREAVENVISTVGLDSSSHKHVGKYSMGMRQRLGIAQALIEDPSVLIFDEPMNGLDDSGVCRMREMFSGFRDQGKTMLITSHDTRDIDALCDSVYLMESGVISRLR